MPCWFPVSVNSFDYLGSILSYIAIAFPIFLGTYDDLIAPDLSALISAVSFATNISLLSWMLEQNGQEIVIIIEINITNLLVQNGQE